MDVIPTNKQTGLCSICSEEVSVLTQKLQQSNNAKRWKKFGKCCVTCDSPEYYKHRRRSLYREYLTYRNETLPQTLDSERSSENAIRSEIGISTDKSSKRVNLKVYGRLIAAGKFLGTLGVLTGISFFYIESFILLIIAAVLILVGIVLCRFCVWKKYRL